MARFQVPAVVTHANIRPLLARLLEEPWFKIGARPKGPWPKDAWFYRPAILEIPLGELAKGGLNNLALVGMGGNYTTAPLTGKEGFDAQGLEGKALIRKPLFNALMNMRDLIPVHRGRIITARLDEYVAGQKIDRNPGRRGGKARRNPDALRGPASYASMSDRDLMRLHRKLHERIFQKMKGGTKFGVDLRTLKMLEPGLVAEGQALERELKRRGMVDIHGYIKPRTSLAGSYAPFTAAKNPTGFRYRAKPSFPGEARYWLYAYDPGIVRGVRVGFAGSLAEVKKKMAKMAPGDWSFDRETHRKLTRDEVMGSRKTGVRWPLREWATGRNPGTHKSPPFRIQYLPVNQRWVMTWGEQLIPIHDVRSFPSKAAAIKAAEAAGIKVDHKTGICKNPGPAYHKREQARYGRLLAGDLKAGHKEAAEYWQGALSAEAASVAAGKVTRNPARRDLIAKAVLKFYQAQPVHIKKLMGRMSPEQLVLFVRKHSK